MAKQKESENRNDKSFLLSQLRQTAEYKKYLREHAEIVRTYNTDVIGYMPRRKHSNSSPTKEWES